MSSRLAKGQLRSNGDPYIGSRTNVVEIVSQDVHQFPVLPMWSTSIADTHDLLSHLVPKIISYSGFQCTRVLHPLHALNDPASCNQPLYPQISSTAFRATEAISILWSLRLRCIGTLSLSMWLTGRGASVSKLPCSASSSMRRRGS